MVQRRYLLDNQQAEAGERFDALQQVEDGVPVPVGRTGDGPLVREKVDP
jgi:hypothetical protein